MVTIIEEMPFVAAVNDSRLHKVCSNCFARRTETLMDIIYKIVELKTCTKCHIIYYCCKRCQIVDWKFHKHECNFLVKSKRCPPIAVRIMSRIIMRMKTGDVPAAFNGTTFDDLADNLDDVSSSWEYNKSAKFIYHALIKFMGAENVPPQKEVVSIYAKYAINVYKIRDDTCGFKDLGRALYIGLSVHKHNCRPDCQYMSLGSKAILRASDAYEGYCKALTISYCKVLLPKQFRRRDLFSHYKFICYCERCTDEEEDLLERSGRSSCCPDGVVLPRDNGKPLVCSICKKESSLTVKEINDANIRLEMFSAEKSRKAIVEETLFEEMDIFVQLFENMERILSSYNLYLINMAETLKSVCLRIYSEYKWKAMDKQLKGVCLRFCLEDTVRFHKAQEKAIDYYVPFGLSKVMYALDASIIEKERNRNQAEVSVKQTTKVVDAWRKLYIASKYHCGPDYPFTKKTLEECRNLQQIKKAVGIDDDDIIKRMTDMYL